jgi:hypothetical protein
MSSIAARACGCLDKSLPTKRGSVLYNSSLDLWESDQTPALFGACGYVEEGITSSGSSVCKAVVSVAVADAEAVLVAVSVLVAVATNRLDAVAKRRALTLSFVGLCFAVWSCCSVLSYIYCYGLSH